LTSAPTVGRDLGGTLIRTAGPRWFADTEEVTCAAPKIPSSLRPAVRNRSFLRQAAAAALPGSWMRPEPVSAFNVAPPTVSQGSATVVRMGHLLGYARVSTTDQQPHLQVDALERAGCYRVFVETASGTAADRPVLEQVLD
jgi:hypothetical protein